MVEVWAARVGVREAARVAVERVEERVEIVEECVEMVAVVAMMVEEETTGACWVGWAGRKGAAAAVNGRSHK